MVDNTIVLTDDEGKEWNFELFDVSEYEGEQYIYLLPVDEQGPSEIVILRVEEGDDGEEVYFGVDDERLLDALYQSFKERFRDEFDFLDE